MPRQLQTLGEGLSPGLALQGGRARDRSNHKEMQTRSAVPVCLTDTPRAPSTPHKHLGGVPAAMPTPRLPPWNLLL